MKWLQLAYSIISVNAVILALLAVIVNLLETARSRMTTDAKNNCVYSGDDLKKMRGTINQAAEKFGSGEIRVLDASGKLERMIAFDETDRKL